MFDYFSAPIIITQMALSTMYFDSIESADHVSNCAAATSDTMQEPLSTYCIYSCFSVLI